MRWVPLCSILLTGCAGNLRVAQPKAIDHSPILRVVGRFNLAHACPVGRNLALTNAHVTDIRPFDDSIRAYPMVWSDGVGKNGVLVPTVLDRARDLALMESDTDFDKWYDLADNAPIEGARVWFVGYDWSSKDKALAARVIETAVNRVLAGHLVLRDAGQPGSSGSCVLDDSGKLVAINSGSIALGLNGEVGFAVGVWKGLLPDSAMITN